MMRSLAEALQLLDTGNPEHWTTDNVPTVAVVSELIGRPTTRKEITDAAPNLTRARMEAGEGFTPIGSPAHDKEVEDAEKAPQEPAPEPEPDEAPEETEAQPAPDEAPVVDPGAEPLTGAEPPEDPEASAYVEPWDQVVAATEAQVFADPVLIDRAIVEFGRQAAILTERREAILSKLKDVGRRSAYLTKVRNDLNKAQKTEDRENINTYLKSQNEARRKRVEAATTFLKAGTTAEDVKAQLGGPSRIDQALKQRKPGRGAGRPMVPPKAGVGS